MFSVPGDALAGAAAAGARPNRGTAYAIGASLCLYEAGMALNDWADRDEDAVERPHRPIPSGRVRQGAALAAAGVLTAAGLALAARAGRPALAVATALSATVWAYDLRLKHTAAGPVAMGAARGLDLLLGATATVAATSPRPGGPSRSRVPGRPPTDAPGAARARTSGGAAGPHGVPFGTAPAVPAVGGGARSTDGGATQAAAPVGRGGLGPWEPGRPTSGVAAALRAVRSAGPAAGALAAHTLAVTSVSRHETQGGSTLAPLAALATAAALAVATARPGGPVRQDGAPVPVTAARPAAPAAPVLLAAAYLRTAGRPLLHAALNPSPELTQRAVGGGIRAMIPLQAALAARAGATGSALVVAGLAPAARRLARKVSLT
ncbi:SCO3242 family prenyltransferase [Streptomyces sp. NPDC005805]|uniref:SCO3242 family prenyltransferase n=1 Tax=Streptomyces sp. NPDC005805 TaxID=3157068 RepID=UPI0033CE0584